MSSVSPPDDRIVRFAAFELDPRTGELRRAGVKVALPPQALTILLRLLACPGEMVGREELRRELWPDAAFGDFEHGLNAAIKRLREALGDSADAPRYIETVPRRGYRFLAEAMRDGSDAADSATGVSTPIDPGRLPGPGTPPALIRPSRALVGATAIVAVAVAGVAWIAFHRPDPPVAPRTIAVLPFTSDRPDAEEQYFSEGMTDAITAKLGGIEDLRVTPRTVATRAARTERDPRRVGQALGVAYVLDGVTHRAEQRLRIDVWLTDTQTGYQLWAESFAGDLSDVFAFQEQTALRVANALHVRLSANDLKTIRGHAPGNAAAYDEYLRGKALVRAWDAPTREGRFGNPAMLQEAQRHFERAMALEPNYALALAGLAQVHLALYEGGRRSGGGRKADPPYDFTLERLDRAERLVRQALAADADLSDAHLVLGSIQTQRATATGDLTERERAVAELHEALRLDPQYSWIGTVLAWCLLGFGPERAVEAERAARGAIAVDPREFWAYFELGSALRLQNRYGEALAAMQDGLAIRPDWTDMRLLIAKTYLANGELDRAFQEYQVALRQEPNAPDVHVGLSRVYAARRQTDQALGELERAFVLGYWNVGALDTLAEFASIRTNPRFRRLVSKHSRATH